MIVTAHGIVCVPGTDGRAGMVTLHLKDEHQATLTPAMLVTLSRYIRESLPSYARPRFIRVQPQLTLTSTYKQQKAALVREGFDVSQVRDPLYYLDPSTQAYMPLDQTAFQQIMAGNVPM